MCVCDFVGYVGVCCCIVMLYVVNVFCVCHLFGGVWCVCVKSRYLRLPVVSCVFVIMVVVRV